MDLSRFKWPVIILVVGGLLWLTTDGGTRYIYTNLKTYQPGTDEAQNRANEAGFTRLGNFLLRTFRYERAAIAYTQALERYGDQGQNYWVNLYALARCEEKLGEEQVALDILRRLVAHDAHARDARVPTNAVLQNRIERLAVETAMPGY